MSLIIKNALFFCLVISTMLFSCIGAHAQSPYHGGSGDGYAMAEVKNVVLGIDPSSDIMQKVNLYPNPSKSSGNLEIVCGHATAFKVEIINLLGQAVYSGNFEGEKAIIPLNYCRTGSYVVHIYSGNSGYIQKLVITEP
jgi:hypothetical protein